MKIIDAVWEERNIGVKTFEINIEDKDCMQDFELIEKDLIEKGAEYLVVKTPVNRADFIWELPKLGYTFVEMGFAISLPKKKYTVPVFLSKMDRGIEVELVKKNEQIQKVLLNFKDNIFDTDRISIDPFFRKGISENRYLLWMRDMLQKGCLLYELSIKDKVIGFFILKKKDDETAYPVLAGLYSEYKGKGLGALLIKKCFDTVWDLGYKKIETILVSNNLSIVKIHMSFGFEIDNFIYTYIKHI